MGEFVRNEALDAGIKARLEQAQKDLAQGSVQQRDRQELILEMERVAQEGFARGIDDERLEAQRKAAIREGDPMAAFLNKKRKKKDKANSENISGSEIARGEGPKRKFISSHQNTLGLPHSRTGSTYLLAIAGTL